MRGKGEGSIYQRADGRWVGSIALEPGPDGKRRRQVVYGRTRRDVLTKLDMARGELRVGHEPAPGRARVKVDDVLTAWLAAVQGPHSKLKELTQWSYVDAAETRVRKQLGQVPIARLTDDVIGEWQDNLLDAGYSPRSVLKARVVLSGVIMLARRRRLLFENPLELVEPPTTKKPKKRAISGDEAGRFLAAIRGHPMETLFLADLLTGVRRGELLGWAWADVDLVGATVRMQQQVQRIRRKKDTPIGDRTSTLRLVDPKTDASERRIPIPSLLADRLRAHQLAQLAARADVLAAGKVWPNTDPATGLERLVFTSARGTPIDPRNFNRSFTAFITRVGLAPLTPHELRHSFSTAMQSLGVTPLVVSQMLGHADASVTLRWYTHEIPEAHREAAARMDNYARRLSEEHSVDGYTNGYTKAVAAAESSSDSAVGAAKVPLSQS